MCLGDLLTTPKARRGLGKTESGLAPRDAPILLLPSPDESPHHVPTLTGLFCLLSLIRNWQLQRPEVDSEKQMVFTNNIPKTGFLITPTDPISRRRRQVSLSSGASRRGRVSLPCWA